MTKKRLAIEIGMGTDLRGQDYTKAACRAVRDALHRNYLNVAAAFGIPKEQMIVDIRVGVGKPEEVDASQVAKEAPSGVVSVEAVPGGLDIPMEGGTTLIANAIVSVSYDLAEGVSQ